MTLIQHRRGTAAVWTSVNPVLAGGEIGVELDTLEFKVGDGVTPWVSLPYGNGVGHITVVDGGTPDQVFS